MTQVPDAAIAAPHDLTDAEFAELDELLAATPEPLEPLDAVMFDGYLCGVIAQPVLLEPETWLAHVFDFDGRPLPEGVDATWHRRTTVLAMRRYQALNRALSEDGWFEPLILEPDPDAAEAEASDADPDTTNPVSAALMPWVVGFQHATSVFPDLDELDDDAVMTALARLFRHLPAETDEERELVATLDQEAPLEDLDAGIEELVAAVADLYELTSERRYAVETVRREAPKVGRNDPCPCGSGRKFKQCHGAG